MKETLLQKLQEKYGKDYDIKEADKVYPEELEIFYEYNITLLQSQDGTDIYKLRQKTKDKVFIITTWHTSSDTVLNHLLGL
jgi:hypothetical protein